MNSCLVYTPCLFNTSLARDWMTLISGPVVFTYDLFLVLPKVTAKAHNQNLEKNKLKALNNQGINYFATRKERKYFNCSI